MKVRSCFRYWASHKLRVRSDLRTYRHRTRAYQRRSSQDANMTLARDHGIRYRIFGCFRQGSAASVRKHVCLQVRYAVPRSPGAAPNREQLSRSKAVVARHVLATDDIMSQLSLDAHKRTNHRCVRQKPSAFAHVSLRQVRRAPCQGAMQLRHSARCVPRQTLQRWWLQGYR
jgi:hypothetical protein